MTHNELSAIAMRWLKRPNSSKGHGCQVAVSECSADYVGERPDAIGFRVGHAEGSVVVECKVSRSDFHADKTKQHRQQGCGMGTWRYYMVPKGLLTIADLPQRWGLLEVTSRGHVQVRHGAAASAGNWHAYRDALEAFRHESDVAVERSLLVRLLARVGDAEVVNLRVREAQRAQSRMIREIERLRAETVKLRNRNWQLTLATKENA